MEKKFILKDVDLGTYYHGEELLFDDEPRSAHLFDSEEDALLVAETFGSLFQVETVFVFE